MGANGTPVFDLALGALYLFWALFFVLVLWLHREGKREGYPLVSDRWGRTLRVPIQGFPGVPPKKHFLLAHPIPGHGEDRPERDLTGIAVGVDGQPGSPIVPLGNPMVDGLGAAAWAERADVPDMTFDDNVPKIVPLRAAPGYDQAEEDPDPRGKPVVTLDGKIAGTGVDLWVDKSEALFRYLEVEVMGSGRRVLVPMFTLTISGSGRVKLRSVTAEQLAGAPGLKHPETITLLEEDKIQAYFGGGHYYATPDRSEPFA
jgi:photosynthetic reaction center H subunit